MRTPESYSFGSVLKKALDPRDSFVEKAKKTAAQKDVGRLVRMRNQITDTIEEYIRHFQAGSYVEALEEAHFAAKDFTAAASRLDKLPFDVAESVDTLKQCVKAVGILADTVEHMMGPKKSVDEDDVEYVKEQMNRLIAVFNAAHKTFDEAVAHAEQEIGR
jgi:hypothetical protein